MPDPTLGWPAPDGLSGAGAGAGTGARPAVDVEAWPAPGDGGATASAAATPSDTPGLLDRAYDTVMAAPKFITDPADRVAHTLSAMAEARDNASPKDNWYTRGAAALDGLNAKMLGGGVRTLANQLSLGNVAATLLTGGAGKALEEAIPLGKAAIQGVHAGLAGLQAAHGVETAQGAGDDLWTRAAGIGESLLGLYGLKGVAGHLGSGGASAAEDAANALNTDRPRIAPGQTTPDMAPTPRSRTNYVPQDGDIVRQPSGKAAGGVRFRDTEANALPVPPTPVAPRTPLPASTLDYDPDASRGPVTRRGQVEGLDPAQLAPRRSSQDVAREVSQQLLPRRAETSDIASASEANAAAAGAARLTGPGWDSTGTPHFDAGPPADAQPGQLPLSGATAQRDLFDVNTPTRTAAPVDDLARMKQTLGLAEGPSPAPAVRAPTAAPAPTPVELEPAAAVAEEGEVPPRPTPTPTGARAPGPGQETAAPGPVHAMPVPPHDPTLTPGPVHTTLPEVVPREPSSGIAGVREELAKLGLVPRQAPEPTMGRGKLESLDDPTAPLPTTLPTPESMGDPMGDLRQALADQKLLPDTSIPGPIRRLHAALGPKWQAALDAQQGDGIPFTVDPRESLDEFHQRVTTDPPASLMGAEKKARAQVDAGEVGAVSPQLLTTLAGTGVGAAVGGAAAEPDHRLRGAIEGGLFGLAGAGALAHPNAAKSLRATGLFGPVSVAKKALGDTSNSGIEALTRLLTGDAAGAGRIVKSVAHPDTLSRIAEHFQHPDENAFSQASPFPAAVEQYTGASTRALGAITEGFQDRLQHAGLSPAEAARVTMVDEPHTDTGQALLELSRKGVFPAAMPVARVPINQTEMAIEHTPGLGQVDLARRALGDTPPSPDEWKRSLAKAGIGAAAIGGGVAHQVFGGDGKYDPNAPSTLPDKLGRSMLGVLGPLEAAGEGIGAAFSPARSKTAGSAGARGLKAAWQALLKNSPLPTGMDISPSRLATEFVPNTLDTVGQMAGAPPAKDFDTSGGVLDGALSHIPGLASLLLNKKRRAGRGPR